jgi:hypothetical protein
MNEPGAVSRAIEQDRGHLQMVLSPNTPMACASRADWRIAASADEAKVVQAVNCRDVVFCGMLIGLN